MLRAAWARCQLNGVLLVSSSLIVCPACGVQRKRCGYVLERWLLKPRTISPWVYIYTVCCQCDYHGGNWYQLARVGDVTVEMPVTLHPECEIEGLHNVSLPVGHGAVEHLMERR